jgi:4-aminobutyrate aminotransferase-like enzyme/Ser/Thr protein kinase RdoA (MazF antagonist)
MTSVADAPRFSISDAARIATELFGIAGTAAALPSERDQNFRLIGGDGTRHVLKVANQAERFEVIGAENAVMRHLKDTGLTPQLLPALGNTAEDRAWTVDVMDEHTLRVDSHFVRVISHLRGAPYGRSRLQTSALRESLGRAVGRVDQALAGFDHPACHREFAWDLDGARDRVADDVPLLQSSELIAAVTTLLTGYDGAVASRLDGLRRGVIHNDANDFNVLVDPRGQVVTGIIDFGDMVHSQIVNDVAVAMAYACLGTIDPLAAAADVVRGYHAEHPLDENEIASVFHLMCLRLCLSACMAARQRAANPDNEYLGISQGPIANTLPRLAEIHPRLAHYTMRAACGWEPVPHSKRIRKWIDARRGEFARVTEFDLGGSQAVALDMSVSSPLVSSQPHENAAEPLTRRIDQRLADAGASVGYGGYNEARVLYSSEAFAGGGPEDERRTVHVAVDLSLAAGSPMFAPLDGVVHGFEFADSPGDYGPVIVLRHEVADADGPLTFHTLYGHLSVDSLEGREIGQFISAGERLAKIGEAPTNGDWWPHVHVQLVIDTLDVACNLNGACRPSDRSLWLSLCPDPSALLGLPDSSPTAVATTLVERLVERRAQRTGGNLSVSYGNRPLHIERGWMQYLYDADGQRFIDGYNNVAHVGHSHPRVVRRLAEQLAVLNTNTRYLQTQLLDYADDLTALLPPELSVCFFTASGSEANELAIRLARAHTGGRELLVMDSAYHGHTTTLINISPYKHDGPGGNGAPKWVHTTPTPDVYRGAYRADHPNPGAAYAADVQGVIDRLLADGRSITGYIAETCPSVGGQIMLPDGFLAATYGAVRAAGGVCIADEVQTGFGRTGTHFWAFEAHDVVPDIVVLGKPIANGYPMGAVITTPEIAASFNNGMEFFSTFGGSTAACVAAHETLRVVQNEGLQAHALNIGSRLLAGFGGLKLRHDLIGDVRGSGLFLGVELVRNRKSLEPAADEASWIVKRMRDLGVLVGTDGPLHNVIKVRGPMPLTAVDAGRIIDTMDQALAECPFQR